MKRRLLGVWAAAGLAAAGLSACQTAPRTRADIVKTASACQPFSVSIYFETDSAALTREARAVLRDAARMARGCTVDQVEVTGLADSVGASDFNLALSQRRVRAVEGALTRSGFRKVGFSSAAVGDLGAVTADGASRPLRRRADVAFKLSAPAA